MMVCSCPFLKHGHTQKWVYNNLFMLILETFTDSKMSIWRSDHTQFWKMSTLKNEQVIICLYSFLKPRHTQEWAHDILFLSICISSEMNTSMFQIWTILGQSHFEYMIYLDLSTFNSFLKLSFLECNCAKFNSKLFMEFRN